MWVVFVCVGGDEREMVMVYLCLYWSCFFSLFMVLYLMCVSLILTFQLIMLSSCLGSE